MQKARDHKQRSTSRAVYLGDRVAEAVVRIGGCAVLAAVLGICVYLLWTALPLFKGGSAVAGPSQTLHTSEGGIASASRALLLGEYGEAAGVLDAGGTLRTFSLSSGAEFAQAQVSSGKVITAISQPAAGGQVAIGLSDGTLLTGTLSMPSQTLADADVPDDLKTLKVGAEAVSSGSLVQRTRADQFRATLPNVQLREFQGGGGNGSPVVRLDLRENPSGGRFLAAVHADGTAEYGTVTSITPLGGGQSVDSVNSITIPLASADPGIPDWVFVTADGRHVFVLWKSGELHRFTTAITPASGDAAVILAEVTRAAPVGIRVSAAAMLLGGQTLVVGDSAGNVRAYDAARDPTSPAPDAMRLVEESAFSVGNSPVIALAMGERDRIVAAAAESGEVVIRHMTSRKTTARVAAGQQLRRIALGPKGDTLLAIDASGGYQTWILSLGHADAGAASLFAPLMYEGEASRHFTYQSSAGSDSAEIKLSLVPLIFGTVKATIVGMLFAVPLGVLGAIYSSEFMDKRLRRVVKPAIEMMASLPSVVLGFVAAMVIAPLVRDLLPRVLVVVVLAPVLLGLAAHLWQLVPADVAARALRRARMAIIAGVLLGSVAIAASVAPRVERALFSPTHEDALVASGHAEPAPPAGRPAWVGQRQTMSPDEERGLRAQGLFFRGGQVVRPIEAAVPLSAAGAPGVQRWLDGSIGTAFPGWLLALFLPASILVYVIQARLIDRERFEQVLGHTRMAMAIAELARFVLVILAGAGVSVGLAAAFTRLGWDTRDSIFGPFSQRNALVVGVVMGFAVIPLVFTISEDALRSVPNALRSASLGVGATPWQTAVRVVLPAAGSGIFSAIMIGLGRAVGETMIVLMAAGNAPEISANIFSGFRTLAANIAVELPEADKGGTHYRVLFLCGLVLFAMTFVINTTAEVVRQRFRKRNAAL